MDRRTGVVVLAAVAVGLALRVVDITAASYSNDEAYSMWVVDEAARFWARLSVDGHPPLWYGFLALWTRAAGESDVAGRLSSAVAIVALVPVTALAALRLFDARTARWAAMLVAVWPMLVTEERDVRMYAWLPVLTAAALLLLARARDRRRTMDWALAGVALAALAATHHFGTVVAAGLVFGAALDVSSRRGLALTSAVAALLYAPIALLLVFLVQAFPAGASRGIGPGSFLQLVTGLTVGPLAFADPALLLGGACVTLVAAAIGARHAGRAGPWLAVALAFGTILPVALAAWVFPFPPAARYFTAAVPLLALLVARFAATASGPGARSYVVFVTAILVAGSVWALATAAATSDDWRGLATRVARETHDETTVYVAPSFFRVPFARYATGALPVRSVPDLPASSTYFRPATTGDLRAAVEVPEAHWLLISDALLAQEPEIARLLDARGVAVPTGWWMRAYRLPAR